MHQLSAAHTNMKWGTRRQCNILVRYSAAFTLSITQMLLSKTIMSAITVWVWLWYVLYLLFWHNGICSDSPTFFLQWQSFLLSANNNAHNLNPRGELCPTFVVVLATFSFVLNKIWLNQHTWKAFHIHHNSFWLPFCQCLQTRHIHVSSSPAWPTGCPSCCACLLWIGG